jgi:hypothetical protein
MSRCRKYVEWNNSTFISCGSRSVADVSFPYLYKNHSILTLYKRFQFVLHSEYLLVHYYEQLMLYKDTKRV